MEKKNKPGQGRKKSLNPKVLLNFRVDPKLKKDAKKKYPKELNGKMIEFLTKITYEDS